MSAAEHPPLAPASSWWRRRTEVDLRDLRIAGGLMLVGAAIRPFVGHGSVGFACPLFTSTGIPCPLCGMTTSVTATAQLEIGDALAANPAGVVAVVVAVVLLVAWRVRTVALPVWLVPAALAAMWVFELVRFGIMRMPGAT